jgi:DnaK suppressor protein
VKPEPGDEALELEGVERELRARLEEVCGRLAVLKKPPERGSGIGFGKRIGDGTTEAISRLNDVGVADSLDAIESRLERALAKIEEGTYGICDNCGLEIPGGRLQSVPESAACVACAK